MRIAILGMLLLSMPAPQPPTPLASLAGTWTTTFSPPPGNAPVVAPSFTLAVKDGEVLVTFPRDKEPRKAIPLAKIGRIPDDEVAVLLMSGPTPTSRFMLRPVGPGELRLEFYREQAPGGRAGYHEEIFRKR